MKLETEFVKLPLLFDVERLKQEVAQFPEDEWMSHTTGFAGNSSIPLISLDGERNDALHGPMKSTPALQLCEYIQQIMGAFGEVFSRSRLMRLEPGAEVSPHADVNYHWYNRVRIHIPVTTTEDVIFYCGDQHVHMAAGECWIFNSWLEHKVENNSDKTRVHLVLDTTGSTRFWDLVERGEWPFKVRQQLAVQPSAIHYEPNKPAQIRTETYNAPLVQSPGELENLIRGLVDGIESSPKPNEKSREAFVILTRNFIRAWYEVWSEHGMKPSGWPLYHELVNKVDQAASLITPALILDGNGVELADALRALVLSSAINEEFAPQYLDKDDLPDNLKKTTRFFSDDQKESKHSGDNAKKVTETQKASVEERNEKEVEKQGVEAIRKVGRNEPCSCGSGKRYKHCHGRI